MDISYKTLPALAAYIDRIGAEQLNIRRFMVKQYVGKYYVERVLIKIENDGTITCSDKDYAPTKEEAEAIKASISSVNFPRTIAAEEGQLRELIDKRLRPGSSYFAFFNHEGKISMVQERALINGEKAYLPWTFFSDGEWRMMEPDGPLPMWKPRPTSSKPRIMIHEGAKAACAVNAMVEDSTSTHPWRDWLMDYEHWGMIGGALAPQRTNYDELRREKPLEVVYVCDNDDQGKSALQVVSRCYRGHLSGMIFGDAFDDGWDMADPLPKEFFTAEGRYIGIHCKNMLIPATWATDVVPSAKGQGRPTVKISREFSKEWVHTIAPEYFIHRDRPDDLLAEDQFNSKVRPYSDAKNTADLLRVEQKSKAAIIRYNPSEKPGVFHSRDGKYYVNTHVPSSVEPEKGDPNPWLQFCEHLIPIESDRLEVLRWVATLIARPDVKMHYGLLLISETQGVGKGTICDGVLTPIIGENNVSHPTEDTIVNSSFNAWIAQKRLAVVHEIYAGHSAKAYNKMKSIITDELVEVNRKFTHEYTLQNWLHVAACSNSIGALRLSVDDRRWLVPKVTEEKPPTEYWTKFYRWLKEENGHSIIAWWAEEFLKMNTYVMTGDAAPWTSNKKDVIEEGYSPGMKLTTELIRRLNSILNGEYPEDLVRLTSQNMVKNGQAFLRDVDVVNVIRQQYHSGANGASFLEKPSTIRKVARMEGWHSGPKTTIRKFGSENFRPICSSKAMAETAMNQIIHDEHLEPIDLSLILKL